LLAAFHPTARTEIDHITQKAYSAFLDWRAIPAPQRGDLIRLLGLEIRRAKRELASLITLEMGKTITESLGEVQEIIDMCDFAQGIARQLYGCTITSERPHHHISENWLPLGICGVITPFNFPAAVWGWNATLALVCGNAVIWKPSEKTTLTALAVHSLFERAAQAYNKEHKISVPLHLSSLVLGGQKWTETLADSPLIPLISATGSTEMGRSLGQRLAKRFARSILELGGNNASIVTPSADLTLAAQAITFSAVGTSGQRCTTLRRLFIHETLYDQLIKQLLIGYKAITIGDPRDHHTLMGPLISAHAYAAMQDALKEAAQAGGRLIYGGDRISVGEASQAYYVRPALIEMPNSMGPALKETFAPILYLMRYSKLEDAISWNNAAAHGLSSSIFTNHLQEAALFTSYSGSDCGMVNVNMGTSGAEVGTAFGGLKDSGWGWEAGSDSWKQYMRRSTVITNTGKTLPLAQGLTFQIN
jgi:aldehyde dehydrogenase (NAD+)